MASPRCHMFSTSFGAARRDTPNSCEIREPLARLIYSTVRTMLSLGLNRFPATSTDVFQFRRFYCRYPTVFNFTLVTLSKASCDESIAHRAGESTERHSRFHDPSRCPASKGRGTRSGASRL
jgi:hypothetical protein